MKIYELTFTGTEKLFEKKEVDCLPRDAEVVPFNFNKPIYYSEKTGQYYYCKNRAMEEAENPGRLYNSLPLNL